MESPRTYACYNKNRINLIEGSSGGVFYALAYEIISSFNGVVFGSVIENGNVFHKRIIEIKDILLLTKSKYVFSDLKNTLQECAIDLLNDKYVLFVGTPCQIVALRRYLNYKKVPDSKLFTADLICHGTPGKKYWDMYLQENGYDLKQIDVNFRYKNPSWKDFSLKIDCGNHHYVGLHSEDPYFRAFLKNYILRECCYSCKFKGENRKSDITLGDFWGCEKYYPEYLNKCGTSLVIIRNNFEIITKMIKKHCFVVPVDYYLAIKNNSAYYTSVSKPYDYKEKHESIEKKGITKTFAMDKCTDSKKKIRLFMKRILKIFIKKRNIVFGKRKTIGIVTDYGYKNFGNRLQNYALRMILKKMGYNSINLVDSYKYPQFSNLIYYFNNYYRRDIYQKRIAIIFKASLRSGEKTFFYNYSRRHKKIVSNLPVVMLGSDQIWNVDYNSKNLLFHLGDFGIQKRNKIISYAASFGGDSLPDEYKSLFFNNLNKLDSISVRERVGKDIVNNLELEADIHLDPTLLLSEDEWENSFKFCTNEIPDSKYIFKYFLKFTGNVILDSSYADIDIIDIMNRESPYYLSNQFDFIKFIKNSELVITDSFHAVVFSFIFKKKVILVDRPGMSSRFSSLFKLLGVELEFNTIIDLSRIDDTTILESKKTSLSYIMNSIKL